MKDFILEAISELSNANVREAKKHSLACNLFSEELGPLIEFNGHYCPKDYDVYCNRLFYNLKLGIEQESIAPEEKILEIKNLRFEILDFKHRMFPNDDVSFIFQRTSTHKSMRFKPIDQELYKKNTLSFFNIQLRLVERIERFLNHQITLLKDHKQKAVSLEPAKPNLFDEVGSKEHLKDIISNFNKLKLYNEVTGRFNLKFNGSKADFEVFLDLVKRIRLIQRSDGTNPTKTELRQLFSFIFNVGKIKNPATTLYQAKERAEKSEHLVTRMLAAYQDFKGDDLL